MKNNIKKYAVVFDFDDVLIKSDARIQVYRNKAFYKSLTPQLFNTFIKDKTDVFDFTDFKDGELILKAKKYKMWPFLKKLNKLIKSKKINADIIILTARNSEIKSFIHTLLKDDGIMLDISHIITMGDDKGDINIANEKKKILQQLIKKYSKIIFFDDDIQNIRKANTIQRVKAKLVENSINEAIKHLSPKSEEEIRSSFKNLSPQEKLETGSEEGLLWLVKDALAAGADVHAEDDYALRWASKNGHVEVVKVLLAVGADVHARDDYALQWASKNGHVEVVKVLLAAGADVHAGDDYALQWASRNGHIEVVKVLKDHIKKKKINEAIKHLSPKSKEEINKALKNLSPNEKVNTGVNQNLLWVVKKGLEEGGLVTEFQINSAINWNNREILYLFSKEPLKYTDKLKIGFYLQDSDISNEAIKKGAIV